MTDSVDQLSLENGQSQTLIAHSMSMVWAQGIPLSKAVFKLFRSRWLGTFPTNTGELGCAGGVDCSCTDANANASEYSDVYKTFLSDFFIAQVIILQSELYLMFRRVALSVHGDGFTGKFDDYEVAE